MKPTVIPDTPEMPRSKRLTTAQSSAATFSLVHQSRLIQDQQQNVGAAQPSRVIQDKIVQDTPDNDSAHRFYMEKKMKYSRRKDISTIPSEETFVQQSQEVLSSTIVASSPFLTRKPREFSSSSNLKPSGISTDAKCIEQISTPITSIPSTPTSSLSESSTPPASGGSGAAGSSSSRRKKGKPCKIVAWDKLESVDPIASSVIRNTNNSAESAVSDEKGSSNINDKPTDHKPFSEPTAIPNNKTKTNNVNKPEITISSVSGNSSSKESVSSSGNSSNNVAISTGSKRLEIVHNLQEKMDTMKKPSAAKKRDSISKSRRLSSLNSRSFVDYIINKEKTPSPATKLIKERLARSFAAEDSSDEEVGEGNGEGEPKDQNKAGKEPANDVNIEDDKNGDEIASGRKSIFISGNLKSRAKAQMQSGGGSARNPGQSGSRNQIQSGSRNNLETVKEAANKKESKSRKNLSKELGEPGLMNESADSSMLAVPFNDTTVTTERRRGGRRSNAVQGGETSLRKHITSSTRRNSTDKTSSSVSRNNSEQNATEESSISVSGIEGLSFQNFSSESAKAAINRLEKEGWNSDIERQLTGGKNKSTSQQNKNMSTTTDNNKQQPQQQQPTCDKTNNSKQPPTTNTRKSMKRKYEYEGTSSTGAGSAVVGQKSAKRSKLAGNGGGVIYSNKSEMEICATPMMQKLSTKVRTEQKTSLTPQPMELCDTPARRSGRKSTQASTLATEGLLKSPALLKESRVANTEAEEPPTSPTRVAKSSGIKSATKKADELCKAGPSGVMNVKNKDAKTTTSNDAKSSDNDCDVDIPATQKPPIFHNLTFFVEIMNGRYNIGASTVKKIKEYGGTVVQKLYKRVTHVIFHFGTRVNYQKAKKLGVPILSSDFVDKSIAEDKLLAPADFPSINIEDYDKGKFPSIRKLKSMTIRPTEERMQIIEEKMKRKQRKEQREREKEEARRKAVQIPRPKPVYYPPLYYEGSPYLEKEKKEDKLANIIKEIKSPNGSPIRMEYFKAPSTPVWEDENEINLSLADRLLYRYKKNKALEKGNSSMQDSPKTADESITETPPANKIFESSSLDTTGKPRRLHPAPQSETTLEESPDVNTTKPLNSTKGGRGKKSKFRQQKETTGKSQIESSKTVPNGEDTEGEESTMVQEENDEGISSRRRSGRASTQLATKVSNILAAQEANSPTKQQNCGGKPALEDSKSSDDPLPTTTPKSSKTTKGSSSDDSEKNAKNANKKSAKNVDKKSAKNADVDNISPIEKKKRGRKPKNQDVDAELEKVEGNYGRPNLESTRLSTAQTNKPTRGSKKQYLESTRLSEMGGNAPTSSKDPKVHETALKKSANASKAPSIASKKKQPGPFVDSDESSPIVSKGISHRSNKTLSSNATLVAPKPAPSRNSSIAPKAPPSRHSSVAPKAPPSRPSLVSPPDQFKDSNTTSPNKSAAELENDRLFDALLSSNFGASPPGAVNALTPTSTNTTTGKRATATAPTAENGSGRKKFIFSKSTSENDKTTTPTTKTNSKKPTSSKHAATQQQDPKLAKNRNVTPNATSPAAAQLTASNSNVVGTSGHVTCPSPRASRAAAPSPSASPRQESGLSPRHQQSSSSPRPNTKSTTDWLGGKQWEGGSSREGAGAAGKTKSTANLSASAANIYQASLSKTRSQPSAKVDGTAANTTNTTSPQSSSPETSSPLKRNKVLAPWRVVQESPHQPENVSKDNVYDFDSFPDELDRSWVASTQAVSRTTTAGGGSGAPSGPQESSGHVGKMFRVSPSKPQGTFLLRSKLTVPPAGKLSLNSVLKSSTASNPSSSAHSHQGPSKSGTSGSLHVSPTAPPSHSHATLPDRNLKPANTNTVSSNKTSSVYDYDDENNSKSSSDHSSQHKPSIYSSSRHNDINNVHTVSHVTASTADHHDHERNGAKSQSADYTHDGASDFGAKTTHSNDDFGAKSTWHHQSADYGAQPPPLLPPSDGGNEIEKPQRAAKKALLSRIFSKPPSASQSQKDHDDHSPSKEFKESSSKQKSDETESNNENVNTHKPVICQEEITQRTLTSHHHRKRKLYSQDVLDETAKNSPGSAHQGIQKPPEVENVHVPSTNPTQSKSKKSSSSTKHSSSQQQKQDLEEREEPQSEFKKPPSVSSKGGGGKSAVGGKKRRKKKASSEEEGDSSEDSQKSSSSENSTSSSSSYKKGLMKSRRSSAEFAPLPKFLRKMEEREASRKLTLDDKDASGSSNSISSTDTSKSRRRGATRNIVCTSCNQEDINLVQQLIQSYGKYTLSTAVNSRTSHVISGEGKRTLNLLKGLLAGCWLVTTEWVVSSLEAGQWVDEEPYEMVDFSPAVRSLRRERETWRDAFKSELFKQVGAIYISPNCRAPRDELKQLVHAGGGLVTSQARIAQVKVGDCGNGGGVGKNATSTNSDGEEVNCVTEKWILDSVQFHMVLPFSDYPIR